MSSIVAESLVGTPPAAKRLNPAELKIDLLCQGVRVDEMCPLSEGRPVRSQACGLASGLELILPGDMMELWVNVPIRERFVAHSPYHLEKLNGEYCIRDQRNNLIYGVKLAPDPGWYDSLTRQSGTPMSRIGMLEGTFLVIEIGEPCSFWTSPEDLACRFCRKAEPGAWGPHEKSVADVVETVLAAQKKSAATPVLLRGGYYGAGGLARVFPYVKAIREQSTISLALQFPPEPDLSLYDQSHALGVDHFSFRLEFFNKDFEDHFAPGKAAVRMRESFFKAIEYCAQRSGKARISGEIFAGIEPIEDTFMAIDYIVGVGALPLVNIFRPLLGTEMENYPAPSTSEMFRVFRHVYEACCARRLPLGLAPNIRMSALLHPADTLYLASDQQESRDYLRWIATMKQVMRPYITQRKRKNRL